MFQKEFHSFSVNNISIFLRKPVWLLDTTLLKILHYNTLLQFGNGFHYRNGSNGLEKGNLNFMFRDFNYW